jgi:hypothetical protein
MRSRPILLAVGLSLACVGGYWLARSAVPDSPERPQAAVDSRAGGNDLPERDPRVRPARSGGARDQEALDQGGLPNQRAIVFKDREALERFLAMAGDRIKVLGRIDALNALRIGFSDLGDLAGLLDGDEELSMIFPVTLPEDELVGADPGAVPLGSKLLEWLGITGDNSEWGKGLLIAVLDTGIESHPAFASRIRSLDLVSPGSDPSSWHPHGTAVVSTIIGNHSRTPGVAPGADILDLRVADSNGFSNSFTLAQGIMAAADAGAAVLVISLGSDRNSVLVENAVAYAISKGSVIVAAAGNGGREQVSYPAGNHGVISVGGVDARGSHLTFSNAGKVDIAAPGYGVNVAWPGGSSASVSGTSFSTPIVAGVVAGIMTHGGARPISGPAAVDLMLTHANEAGAPGPDPRMGVGLPSVDRVFNSTVPGRFDAAVASHHVLPPTATTPYPQLQVVVQNRGTETLFNTAVSVTTPTGTVRSNVPMLKPNSIQTVNIPLSRLAYDSGAPMRFDSAVQVGGGRYDVNPNNDRRIETFTPPKAP